MTAQQIDQSPTSAAPNGFANLVNAGRDALNAGDLPLAKDLFIRAATLHPDRPESHNNLGAFYMGLADFIAAESCFATLTDMMPENPSCRFNLAMARFRQNKYEDAARDFAIVTEQIPDDAEAWNNLGAARCLAGDIEQARQDLTRALQLQPNYPNAVLNLCDLEYADHKVESAIGLCEAYLEHQHDLGVMRRLLEILDEQASIFLDRAIPHAEAVVHASGKDEAACRHLGDLLEARKTLAATAG